MLETDNKKITRTWREMLTSLQQPMMMKKGGQQILVVYLDTTGIIIISRLNIRTHNNNNLTSVTMGYGQFEKAISKRYVSQIANLKMF